METNTTNNFFKYFPVFYMVVMILLAYSIYAKVAKMADKEGFVDPKKKSAFKVRTGPTKSTEKFTIDQANWDNCMSQCAANSWNMAGSQYDDTTQCQMDCSHLVNYF